MMDSELELRKRLADRPNINICTCMHSIVHMLKPNARKARNRLAHTPPILTMSHMHPHSIPKAGATGQGGRGLECERFRKARKAHKDQHSPLPLHPFGELGGKKNILLAIPRIEDHAENGNLCYAFIGDDSCIRGHLSTTATSSTKVYDARTVSRSKRFTCKRRRDAATISLFSASSPRRTPRIYNNGAA